MLNTQPNETVPIDHHRGLVRDMSSMAVINIDKNASKRHKTQRAKIMDDKEQLKRANVEIMNLRNDLDDLKNLIKSHLIDRVETMISGAQTIDAAKK